MRYGNGLISDNKRQVDNMHVKNTFSSAKSLDVVSGHFAIYESPLDPSAMPESQLILCKLSKPKFVEACSVITKIDRSDLNFSSETEFISLRIPRVKNVF